MSPLVAQMPWIGQPALWFAGQWGGSSICSIPSSSPGTIPDATPAMSHWGLGYLGIFKQLQRGRTDCGSCCNPRPNPTWPSKSQDTHQTMHRGAVTIGGRAFLPNFWANRVGVASMCWRVPKRLVSNLGWSQPCSDLFCFSPPKIK